MCPSTRFPKRPESNIIVILSKTRREKHSCYPPHRPHHHITSTVLVTIITSIYLVLRRHPKFCACMTLFNPHNPLKIETWEKRCTERLGDMSKITQLPGTCHPLKKGAAPVKVRLCKQPEHRVSLHMTQDITRWQDWELSSCLVTDRMYGREC